MMPRSLRLLTTQSDAAAIDVSTLVDRYTGRGDHATSLRYLIPGTSPTPGDLDLALIDTSNISNNHIPLNPNLSAIWHVIWVRDEATASATIDAATGTSSWPVAPGDSLNVPPSATLRSTDGQLGILISPRANGWDFHLSPPSHGTDDFHGFNRRTAYPLLGELATYRWKVTQPLDLSLHHDSPVIIVFLAGNSTIATPKESLILRRGQAVMADLQQPTIVYPDGLGYIFIVAVPG